MRVLISTIGLLIALPACGGSPAPAPRTGMHDAPAAMPTDLSRAAVPIDVDGEAVHLRSALMREVPELIVDDPAGERDCGCDEHRADRLATTPRRRRSQSGY